VLIEPVKDRTHILIALVMGLLMAFGLLKPPSIAARGAVMSLAATATTTGTPMPTPTPTPTTTPSPSPTPSVVLSAPTNGSTVTGPTNLTDVITGSVSWVNWYIDGIYLASSPPYTYSWNSATVPNGAHTVSTKAYDTNAVQVGSASANVTVSNTPTPTPVPTPTPSPTSSPTPTPAMGTVTITAPANGATVSGTATNITVTFTGSVSWVNFYVDGVYLVSSPPYTQAWNTTTVTNGSHTISVKAFAVGGVLLAAASESVTVANTSSTPTPNPTPNPTDVLLGDPSAIPGANTNPATYGTYTSFGVGYGLIGGPLLTDAQALAKVVTAQKSSVENSAATCTSSITAACYGSTIAASNAYTANYFASYSQANPSDYMTQVNSFYAAFVGSSWQSSADRIDGACRFTSPPTTAMTLQWAAAKWGINPILMYAEATQEGGWDQTTLGDNGASSGVLQLADRNTVQQPSHTFPGFAGAGLNLSRENNCFNADFYAGHLYAAWRGMTPSYDACPVGDIGACIQVWFSGTVTGAGTYTTSVYNHITSKDWISIYFSGTPVPPVN
jgi:hypothetical protein